MRTTTPIMIPIFVYTDEEFKAIELGLEDPAELGTTESEVRAFYCIDSVYDFDGHSGVFSGGKSFVSPMKPDKLIELINNHNK